MKILNLYAGIGGNRQLWGDKHEITAVEKVPEIAKIYQDFFPNDTVIVGDAREYLVKHYMDFDFIWSSPPCPSHSRIRWMGAKAGDYDAIVPDLSLYEEIIFLKHFFKGKWVVENVVSYYEPLLKPYKYKEHYYWANFPIVGEERAVRKHRSTVGVLAKLKGFNLDKYNGIDKTKILRNCVEPEAGLFVFQSAFKDQQRTL